mmetsp:Transcript_37413/g.87801  ORF Transcript_37413/g.87801 Transcript_37413/m.87801 type:complete len:266 (-) Transcript_37413:42-839(-)
MPPPAPPLEPVPLAAAAPEPLSGPCSVLLSPSLKAARERAQELLPFQLPPPSRPLALWASVSRLPALIWPLVPGPVPEAPGSWALAWALPSAPRAARPFRRPPRALWQQPVPPPAASAFFPSFRQPFSSVRPDTPRGSSQWAGSSPAFRLLCSVRLLLRVLRSSHCSCLRHRSCLQIFRSLGSGLEALAVLAALALLALLAPCRSLGLGLGRLGLGQSLAHSPAAGPCMPAAAATSAAAGTSCWGHNHNLAGSHSHNHPRNLPAW